MTLRPAYWVGTTIRSHRVPAGGGHRATSRRSATRVAPYVAASVAALFLTFSVLVGFHLPTGVVPAWQSPPAGKLFPLEPPTSSSLPSDNPGSEGEVGEGTGRASRSRSRPADQPEQPAPTDAPRPSEAASAAAAAPEPLITVMPTPGCPPPLPVPTVKPKRSKAPKVPKVELPLMPSGTSSP